MENKEKQQDSGAAVENSNYEMPRAASVMKRLSSLLKKHHESILTPPESTTFKEKYAIFSLQSSWCSQLPAQHYCHFWELADGATHFNIKHKIQF